MRGEEGQAILYGYKMANFPETLDHIPKIFNNHSFKELHFYFSIIHCFDAQYELLIKRRYELIGHSLMLDHWLLRYSLVSPQDLFSALLVSPGAILLSPRRLTCEMLRPADG